MQANSLHSRLRLELWAFVSSALLACAFAAACEHGQKQDHLPVPVRVASAEPLEEDGGLKYSANIDAQTQVTLAFKSGGYVERIVERKGADARMRVLQVGDSVRQGEVLAKVRESEYADRVNAANAALDQAQTGYEKAKLDFERANNLFKSDSLTKAQYDAAKASLDQGAASVENARANLQQAKTSLSDCTIISPLTGWVLARNIEVGSLVGTGSSAFVL